jgi:hypothetical protein
MAATEGPGYQPLQRISGTWSSGKEGPTWMNARESEGGRAAGLEWCVHLPESMRPQKKRLVEPSVTTLCLGVQWMWEVSTAMANLGLRLPLPLACKEVHAYLARGSGMAQLTFQKVSSGLCSFPHGQQTQEGPGSFL